MPNERVANTILRYTVDDRSVREAMTSAERIASAIEEVNSGPLGELGPMARLSANALIAQFRAMEAEMDDFRQSGAGLAAAEREAADAADRLAESTNLAASVQRLSNQEYLEAAERVQRYLTVLRHARDEQARIGTGVQVVDRAETAAVQSRRTNLNIVERGFTSVAQLLPGDAGNAARTIADVVQLTDVLPEFAKEIRSITPLGLAAAAAIGAASLAVKQLSDQGREITAGIRSIVEREREYYELRVSGTTDSIQSAIAALEFERRLAQERLEDLQFVELGYEEARKSLGAFANLAIELGGLLNIGGLENLRNARIAFDEAVGAVEPLNQRIAAYSDLLDDATTATNDMIAAEEELAERRRNEAQQYLSDVREQIVERERFLNVLSSNNRDLLEAEEQRLQQDRRIIEAQIELASLGDNADLFSEEDIQELEVQARRIQSNLQLVRQELGRLNSSEALEGFVSGARRVVGAVRDFLQDVIAEAGQIADEVRTGQRQEMLDALQGVVEAQEAVTEAQRDYNEALQKSRDNISAITSELREREAELEREAGDRRLEVLREAQDAREKQEVEHQDSLRKIHQRANATIANAIRTRDVVAAILAQENRDDQLAEEEEGHAKRLKQLDENFKKQNEVIDKRLNEQLARQRASAQRQLQIEHERAQREISLRLQTLQAAQTTLLNAQAAERAIYANHFNGISQISNMGMTNLRTIIQSGLDALVGYAAARFAGGFGIGTLAYSGTTQTYRAPVTAPAPATNNITIYAANTTQQLRNVTNVEARRVMYEILRD